MHHWLTQCWSAPRDSRTGSINAPRPSLPHLLVAPLADCMQGGHWKGCLYSGAEFWQGQYHFRNSPTGQSPSPTPGYPARTRSLCVMWRVRALFQPATGRTPAGHPRPSYIPQRCFQRVWGASSTAYLSATAQREKLLGKIHLFLKRKRFSSTTTHRSCGANSTALYSSRS